jgi:hypothetical protein
MPLGLIIIIHDFSKFYLFRRRFRSCLESCSHYHALSFVFIIFQLSLGSGSIDRPLNPILYRPFVTNCIVAASTSLL